MSSSQSRWIPYVIKINGQLFEIFRIFLHHTTIDRLQASVRTVCTSLLWVSQFFFLLTQNKFLFTSGLSASQIGGCQTKDKIPPECKNDNDHNEDVNRRRNIFKRLQNALGIRIHIREHEEILSSCSTAMRRRRASERA